MLRIVRIAVLALLLVASAAIVPHDGWPHRDALAAGCGNSGTWHVAAYDSGSHQDPLGNVASTDITVWDDGCGNEQGRFSIWTNGVALHDFHIAYREWVCGGLTQVYAGQVQVAWTGWFRKGSCSVGFDNALTSFGYSTVGCTPYACYDAGTDWPYGWYSNTST